MEPSIGGYLNQKIFEPGTKATKDLLNKAADPKILLTPGGLPLFLAGQAYQGKKAISKSYNDYILTEQRKKDAKEAEAAKKAAKNQQKTSAQPTASAGVGSVVGATGATGTARAGATSGGTTGGGSKTTTQKKEKTEQQKFEDDIRKQIENAYKQQINFLSGQEASLQGQMQDYLASVANPFEQQLPVLEQQLKQQQETGAAQQEQLRQQEQQLLAQTRRTGEEAGLRAIQQFGGVGGTSAGQAAGEIIGRELLRQQGAITQQTAAGIQSVRDQLRAIQGEYNSQVAQLRLQREQALSNARLEFQRQLDTIRKEKMTAGVTKAQMTIDALGNFAARRQAIEDQARTQENNLNLLREQAALNAQNLNLQTSLTGQTPTALPFKIGQFFPTGGPAQSNELAKIIQAGVASGALKSFGQNASGEDLFVDPEGKITDTKGNLYGAGTSASLTLPTTQ